MQALAKFTLERGALPMPTDEVLTLKEVATLLKIAERTAYMMVQRGDLPGFKVGGQWRFKRAAIDAWMEAQMRLGRSNQEGGKK